MADDNTIIEGSVKFRDGKKWKWRWCVMRRLSPVADCLHVQLYRDSKERYKKGQSKASLSLQHYLGFESGFTLDKESNTIAIICQDVTVVLAFETRERLIQWQVKVSGQLGEALGYLVLVGAGGVLPAGPARLHLQARRVALTTGVPPRLLGLWDIAHLRRYGVVEGRFCFEGGSHCGRGEGLHVLITDQAHEITHAFNLAALGRLSPRRRPRSLKNSNGFESPNSLKAFRPDSRLSNSNTVDDSLLPTDMTSQGDPGFGEEAGAVSPYWPSAERSNRCDMGLGDTLSVNETVEIREGASWTGSQNVTLERCMSCMSKLGAMSRSSTAALTPGATHPTTAWTMSTSSTAALTPGSFTPAWTMEALHETNNLDSVVECDSRRDIHTKRRQSIKTEHICRCVDNPPERPPKPTLFDLNLTKKTPMPLPVFTCTCNTLKIDDEKYSKVGPYENYDVPKTFTEVDVEYYDTPKRLKECLNSELFRITKSSSANALVLKKSCGCLLKFDDKKGEPNIVDDEENFQPARCPCQRVTSWANSWIKLPYCQRSTNTTSHSVTRNKENLIPNNNSESALYSTIDIARKTKRKQCVDDYKDDMTVTTKEDIHTVDIDEGPSADYENLNFALSLKYYENVKDVLRKAGVTQIELDAISANLNPDCYMTQSDNIVCTRCRHDRIIRETSRSQETIASCTNDDYLMMAPKIGDRIIKSDSCNNYSSPPGYDIPSATSGYTPMSPISNFTFHTLKYSNRSKIGRLIEEKSASNPALFGLSRRVVSDVCKRSHDTAGDSDECERGTNLADRTMRRRRSCSADSSRYLEDVKEFDSSVGSQDSSSSLETLRNMAAACQRAPGLRGSRGEDAHCCVKLDTKHSDADSSDASKECPHSRSEAREVPPLTRSPSSPADTGPTANRDSSSSNDSGVSGCSFKPNSEFIDFELPPTTARTRHRYLSVQRRTSHPRPAPPERSRSSDPLTEMTSQLRKMKTPTKSSSAEAEVPVLTIKPLRGAGAGVVDSRSTSSGTSDMSDYIETLSLCSSHSSTEAPTTLRTSRGSACGSRVRPRSDNEYLRRDAPHCRAPHCRAPHCRAPPRTP